MNLRYLLFCVANTLIIVVFTDLYFFLTKSRLFVHFQFDYLKSLEIEEKINKIRWCQTANNALFLLSTNDKTIKFWKVGKRTVLKFFKVGDYHL